MRGAADSIQDAVRHEHEEGAVGRPVLRAGSECLQHCFHILGGEVLCHVHTVAQALKQPLHPCDIKVSPIPERKMVKLGIAYDKSQTSAILFLLDWIDLQETDMR